ncbi:sirohydrochlorin chelatase [Nostocaceae cyanobacterium CENA369]|uniref:Sirohydrochlorin chelatase n=1 Tax=Dendronalium phyllosphericum CENA369 TaxID=1725256 RepID=A0A8J7IA58_9NOST|nr:sirohydrochlorin chelatase [Dendronalium phyllosphericum]MBH8574307.1 sirohydrochlorin chelatase [Dendronalium phyllosphericum CENA369]
MSSAYLLVSHGSRDPRPEIAMQQLATLVQNKLQKNSLELTPAINSVSSPKSEMVGIAFLEMRPEPLHEQIKQFVQRTLASKGDRLKIIPLFLLPGVHVMTDIPAEIALAQQTLGENIIIDLQPYLGSHPGLETLLAKQIAAIKAQAWIVLAHGSRRSDSQKLVETIAANLGGVAAYLSVSPSLESQVEQLVAAGNREIAILPYFLFAGGITDAIAQAVEKLKLQFPAVTFQLAQPLGASAELADLIGDFMYK